MNSEERRRAIQTALVQMDKQFGKGAVLLLGIAQCDSRHHDFHRIALGRPRARRRRCAARTRH